MIAPTMSSSFESLRVVARFVRISFISRSRVSRNLDSGAGLPVSLASLAVVGVLYSRVSSKLLKGLAQRSRFSQRLQFDLFSLLSLNVFLICARLRDPSSSSGGL